MQKEQGGGRAFHRGHDAQKLADLLAPGLEARGNGGLAHGRAAQRLAQGRQTFLVGANGAGQGRDPVLAGFRRLERVNRRTQV